ncbi:MAG: hypothetical protein JJ895_11485 [Balneolaceae bacterium]|nr:hypothetical protein [Balneolaceae bacterium]
MASGYNDGMNPDSVNASILLDFGIKDIESNGIFNSSTLIFQADTNNSDLSASLRAFPIINEWKELEATYYNKPASDTLFSPATYITPADLVLSENGDTLQIYETDITTLFDSLRTSYNGIQLVSYNRHFIGSKEFTLQVYPPTIKVEILNSTDNSDNDRNIVIGYVQAGDILDISFGSYSDNLFPNFELLEDNLEAEELLSFSQRSECSSSLVITIPTIEEDTTGHNFEFVLDTPQTIPIDTLAGFYQAMVEPELAYQNGDSTLPDIFASYTMELYDVPEVDGFPIAIFSEQDDDGPGGGSFTGRVFLDDFTRNASLLARTDSLTQDSTFKVRVYGYMVKGLTAGKMAAHTTNAADDLFNLPPGYSENNDINDPNCGLPIDALEDNIFVNCFEFRIGDEQPEIEFSIEIPEPKEMWPTIPSTGAPNDFDFSQVESSL